MKRLMHLVLAVTLVCGLSAMSFEQGEAASANKVTPRRVTYIDMNGDEIVGLVSGPDGTLGIVRTTAEFPNRMRLRTSFHDELVRSVDKL